MKIVVIKNSKVIAVWNKAEDTDYLVDYPNFDEKVEVEDDIIVYRGMTQVAPLQFERLPDEEFLIEVDKINKKKEIKKIATLTDQLNMLALIMEEMVLERETITPTMQKGLDMTNGIKNILNK